MNRQGCYDPTSLFKPQWAYDTPDGYRDELYLIPFSFTFIANGTNQALNLPVQLDDDVPFILRALLFPQVGFSSGNTSFVRIRDSQGNPLTDGLILAAGVYGLSGLENNNAFGFPIEPEIECSPGGTILFDFLTSSNGSFASATLVILLGDQIEFFAQLFGTAGNTGLTIQFIDPGAANVPLSVAIVGGIHVRVTLQTNGASAIISTLAQIANIVNSTPAVFALMGAVVSGDPSTVAVAEAQTPLVGGANGSAVTLNGTLIGVKRFKECL